MIAKLLPLMLMTAGVYQGAEKFEPLLNMVTTVSTQSEINEAAHFIELDVVTGTPMPTPEQFGEYLRKNMRNPGKPRDFALDQWGTPYKLVVEGRSGFEIVSAGPDKSFDTDDDVKAIHRF